ncbi:MAG: putative porin [Gammaproteobacteria bacterium]|nr:putative porin [Gammaproteobacteria bacterium]
MKKRLLPILLLSATTFANEPVTTFASASYFSRDDLSSTGFNLKHFFADQNSIGVWDEFGYLDTDSRISVSYRKSESDFTSSDSLYLSGEYFVDSFIVSASHSSRSFNSELSNVTSDDGDANSIGLGYLFGDNLKVQTTFSDQTGVFNVSAQYSHELNSNGDYIGFTVDADSDFNSKSISADYFGQLQSGNYIRLGYRHDIYERSDSTTYSGSYYFSSQTSVSFATDLSFSYGVSMKHYFTPNLALRAGITAFDVEDAENAYQLSVIGQF